MGSKVFSFWQSSPQSLWSFLKRLYKIEDLRRQHPKTRSPIFLESNRLLRRQTRPIMSSFASQFVAFNDNCIWCPASKNSEISRLQCLSRCNFGFIAKPLNCGSFRSAAAKAEYPRMKPWSSLYKHIEQLRFSHRLWWFNWEKMFRAALHTAFITRKFSKCDWSSTVSSNPASCTCSHWRRSIVSDPLVLDHGYWAKRSYMNNLLLKVRSAGLRPTVLQYRMNPMWAVDNFESKVPCCPK